MSFEKWLANIIKVKGIKLSEIVRKTGLYYPSIYQSLYGKRGNRELRSSEVIAICKFLGVNPLDFTNEKGGE